MAKNSKRVLVVQDDPTNAYLLQRVLTRWGYQVALVADTEHAFSLLADFLTSIDLVVVDHALAGSALELCRRIQGQGRAGTHVVLLGGPIDEVSCARARKAGA